MPKKKERKYKVGMPHSVTYLKLIPIFECGVIGVDPIR
jgi:hypothetical protein